MTGSSKLRIKLARCLVLLLIPPFITAGESIALSGGPDPNFGDNGKVQFDLGGYDVGHDLDAYPSGVNVDKIVVVGAIQGNSLDDAFVLQLSESGARDFSFDGDGLVTTAVDVESSYSSVQISQSGQRIAAVGWGRDSGGRHSSLVHAFTPTGTFSPEFGDGLYLTELSGENLVLSTAWQADGKIVASGFMRNESNAIQPLLLRVCASTDGLNCEGAGGTILDPSFGEDGMVKPNLRVSGEFESVILQPDGKILAAGLSYSSLNSDMAVMRFNSSGTVDQSFGSGGVTFVDFGDNDRAKGLALQDDGKVVVGGLAVAPTGVNPGAHFAIARLTEEGELDASFGSGGKSLVAIGPNNYGEEIGLQPDGKIVQVGPTSVGESWGVIRLNPDGSLDCSFNRDGKTIGPWGSAFLFGVDFQSTGDIVAAGGVWADAVNVAVARYQGGDSLCPLQWSGFERISSTQINSGVDVSSWGLNRLDVFGRIAADNSLGHVSWNGANWSAMESLGGVLTSDPSAVSWGLNRVDVVGRGGDSAVWHKYWDRDSWGSWSSLGGAFNFAPDLSSWGQNRLDVFGVGQDQALWHSFWNGSSWSPWERLGGVLTSPPAAVSWGDNRVDVFARGQDGAVWHKFWDGATWSSWGSLGGFVKSGPDAASWGNGRLDVVAIGGDDAIWQSEWNETEWLPWELVGGLSPSDPGIAAWGTGRVDLFLRGKDNHLWHTYGIIGG